MGDWQVLRIQRHGSVAVLPNAKQRGCAGRRRREVLRRRQPQRDRHLRVAEAVHARRAAREQRGLQHGVPAARLRLQRNQAAHERGRRGVLDADSKREEA